MKHCIHCAVQLDPYTGQAQAGGRILFIRLPRDFVNPQQQPDANAVAFAFSMCGPIQEVTQVDNKGGFLVVLGGDLQTAVHTSSSIISVFHGKANLAGDDLVFEMLPIDESFVGALIGRRGENLRNIKATSGAHVEVTPWCGNSATRLCQVYGTQVAVEYARQLILQSTMQPTPTTQSRYQAEPHLGYQAAGPLSSMPMQVPMPMPIATAFEQAYPQTPSPLSLSSTPDDTSSNPTVMSTSPTQYTFLERTFSQEFPALPSESMVPAPPSSPVEASDVEPAVPRTAILKAHWCLLKDRVSMMQELKHGVANFSTVLYESKLQEQLAERRGIRFGVRSKSWTHFLTVDNDSDSDEDEDEIKPQTGVALGRTQTAVALGRTCSSDLLRSPIMPRSGSLVQC